MRPRKCLQLPTGGRRAGGACPGVAPNRSPTPLGVGRELSARSLVSQGIDRPRTRALLYMAYCMILAIATIAPAGFVEHDSKSGSIPTRKTIDPLLVDGDPRSGVANRGTRAWRCSRECRSMTDELARPVANLRRAEVVARRWGTCAGVPDHTSTHSLARHRVTLLQTPNRTPDTPDTSGNSHTSRVVHLHPGWPRFEHPYPARPSDPSGTLFHAD